MPAFRKLCALERTPDFFRVFAELLNMVWHRRDLVSCRAIAFLAIINDLFCRELVSVTNGA